MFIQEHFCFAYLVIYNEKFCVYMYEYSNKMIIHLEKNEYEKIDLFVCYCKQLMFVIKFFINFLHPLTYHFICIMYKSYITYVTFICKSTYLVIITRFHNEYTINI